MEQLLMLSQFKANQHKILKKMIKDYEGLQKSYNHKLIYDPASIHSSETEILTQQIEDLQISFLNLTEDVKSIGALPAQHVLLSLFELIKQSYYFCLRLKSHNRVNSQAEPSKPFQENICPNCHENTQKILISKLKQSFLLTQAGTFPERDLKNQMNAIDLMRECNEYREYLIEGNAFLKQIQEALASKVRTLVSGSGQMAKAYLYLKDNTTNTKENESAKNFSWRQAKFQGADSDKILQKLKKGFFRSFIQSIRYPLFKFIMKFQGKSSFNSPLLPTFSNAEIQTVSFQEADRIRYLQTDNKRLQKQLELIKQSKSQIQAESIKQIKKQADIQEKLLQYRKENIRHEQKIKILIEKVSMLQQKLLEQKKWREQEKQFLTDPLINQIRVRKQNQDRLERELFQIRVKFMDHQKSMRSSLKRNKRIDKEDDQNSSSEQVFENGNKGFREKGLKLSKLKQNKLIGKRKKREKLKIQISFNFIINEPKMLRKKEMTKKTRISYMKQLNPQKSESSIQDQEMQLKYTSNFNALERKQQRRKSKFQQQSYRNQQLEGLNFKRRQSSPFHISEQTMEINDNIRNNYERKKTMKNLNFRILMSDMKSTDRIKIKTEEQQGSKLAQINKNHFSLFGGEKSACEYEKNTGIWPHLSSSDKLVLDFENTHFQTQVQKYFQFLSWAKPEKYIQYGQFLKNPHSFINQKKKKGRSSKVLPNLQKEKINFRFIFNKLIRYHKINHKNCSHVLNFLQDIGFRQL